MCWFLIDSLMKQQIRNSLGTKQKRSISAFCRAPSSTQKCRREICCNLHSLEVLPLSVFYFVSHFMILRCDNKPLQLVVVTNSNAAKYCRVSGFIFVFVFLSVLIRAVIRQCDSNKYCIDSLQFICKFISTILCS